MPAALRRCLLCLLCALTTAAAGADSIDFLPPPVEKFIKKQRLNKKRIGLVLQHSSGAVIASHQAARPFNPASVAKVITALAAIDLLGVEHRWQTKIAAAGAIKNGALHGDLYLTGGGDPYLTVDNLLYLQNLLRSRGIQEIRGDLVIDDSFFSLPPHDPGAFDGASTKPYNVGASGMAVNFKSQRVVFAPQGDTIKVYTDPPNAHFQIDSRVKISNKRCRNWRSKIRERLSGGAHQVTLRLSGPYPRRCGEQSFYLSALDHPAYVAGVFRALWQRLGGTITGGWRQGAAPEKADILIEHDSQPLPLLLAAMNKYSSNVIARHLFLSLAGAGGAPPPYTPEAAQAAFAGWLHSKGIPGAALENGSGLSRSARITPAQMSAVLQLIWRHPYRAEIISSLPVLGKDGTLKRRMKKSPAAGQGHLKTGYLNGITTLSGFFRNQRGETLMLTLFGEKQSARRMRGLQEDIINWAYHHTAPDS